MYISPSILIHTHIYICTCTYILYINMYTYMYNYLHILRWILTPQGSPPLPGSGSLPARQVPPNPSSVGLGSGGQFCACGSDLEGPEISKHVYQKAEKHIHTYVF